MIRVDLRNLAGAAIVAVLLPAGSAAAGKSTVLYSFSGGNDGSVPTSGLIQDKAGNFYSTTDAGGASDHGAVFKLAPDGKETVLYSFAGGSDGEYPQAGLAEDAQGNFYGTTTEGGADNLGTVFKLAPDGTETVLHAFAGGYNDGSSPYAGVIVDAKGNLYGTTQEGGSATCTCGVVFEITRSGKERILYNFRGSPDGAYPLSSLLMDKSGNLYGTTLGGGVQSDFCGVGCGTVFELSPAGRNAWSETVIYSFQGNGNDTTNPWAGVIADSAGNLYGTATGGGNYNLCNFGGCGAVFELSPAGQGVWTENILYAFTGGKDGDTPYAGLVSDAAGNLYGTTFSGTDSANCGFYGCGAIYKIAPDGTEITIHTFKGGAKDAANSSGNLVLDARGNLYGTSQAGGSGPCNEEGQLGCGTVFRLKE
jgi:uncharacterized repeat protein (TIGR03803 family)